MFRRSLCHSMGVTAVLLWMATTICAQEPKADQHHPVHRGTSVHDGNRHHRGINIQNRPGENFGPLHPFSSQLGQQRGHRGSLRHSWRHGFGRPQHHYDYPYYDYPPFSTGMYYGPWFGPNGGGYDPYARSSARYLIYDRDTANGAAVIDAAPLEVPPTVRTTNLALQYQRQAELAFRSESYAEATRLTRHALAEKPNDGRLHQLLAQSMFATGDYRSAAAALHQSVSLLQPDQWGHVVKNHAYYYRGNDYARQLKKLAQHLKDRPDAAYAWFLRGYQYGFLGSLDVARRDLTKALELESRDEIARRLLQRFAESRSETTPETPYVPPAIGL